MYLQYAYHWEVRRKTSAVILCLLGCWLLLSSVAAQNEQHAVVLSVRYGVVEVQPVGTTQWLRLRVGAVMPLVAGDSVRTGRNGRMHIDLRNDAELLMLQDGQLTLLDYRQDGVGYAFAARSEGVSVWRIHNPAQFTRFALYATDFTLTQPAEHFAVWSLPEQHDTLVAASGQAIAQIGTQSYPVAQGDALWADPVQPQFITLEPPVNAVRVEAHLLGCVGVVDTAAYYRGVNVRRGIGQQRELLGVIPNGATVYVLARNRADYWLRVQYLSTFSWIVKEAVSFDEANCPNLRVLPDNSPHERIASVFNALNSEVELLKPFFSTPPNDWLFYRYE